MTEVLASRPIDHSTGGATPSLRTRLVLDTSVLVADPTCVHHLGDVDVVIPLTVIEELDGLKSRPDDVGRAARAALRGIDRIIGAALGQARYASTVMVSNDAALRIKAAHLGVAAAEHQPAGRAEATRNSGWETLDVGADVVDGIYSAGTVDAASLDGAAAIEENEFAVLKAGKQSALTRRTGRHLSLLGHNPPEAWGLRPRSKEQRFALELLADPDVSVVALDGRAGTGKTLLAIAAGLEQVVERRAFERLAIYRPLVPVGRAFLPGGLDEKLDPWMSAIHDAIVALTDQRSSRDARTLIDELTIRNQLSLESVTFLRGRSLHRQMVIVDEAQNLEPTTLKTILTRIG